MNTGQGNLTKEPGITSWILACGCEPGHNHCSQCDHRRGVRGAVDRLRRAKEIAAELAELSSTAERIATEWFDYKRSCGVLGHALDCDCWMAPR